MASTKPLLVIRDDPEKRTIAESLGISDELFDKIYHRFQLARKESNTLAQKKLEEHFGEDQSEERWEKLSLKEKIELSEKLGFSMTKTKDLENFLASDLFLTIGWTPTTPNDFFVLGYAICGVLAGELKGK